MQQQSNERNPQRAAQQQTKHPGAQRDRLTEWQKERLGAGREGLRRIRDAEQRQNRRTQKRQRDDDATGFKGE